MERDRGARAVVELGGPVRHRAVVAVLVAHSRTAGAALAVAGALTASWLLPGAYGWWLTIMGLCGASAVLIAPAHPQLLVLNTPWRSVCRPDCQGLCPNCGQNLNEGDCDCQHQQIDPRLASLQELRQ